MHATARTLLDVIASFQIATQVVEVHQLSRAFPVDDTHARESLIRGHAEASASSNKQNDQSCKSHTSVREVGIADEGHGLELVPRSPAEGRKLLDSKIRINGYEGAPKPYTKTCIG